MPEIGASTVAYIEANLGARPVYFHERPDGTALQRFEITVAYRDGIMLYQVVGTKP